MFACALKTSPSHGFPEMPVEPLQGFTGRPLASCLAGKNRKNSFTQFQRAFEFQPRLRRFLSVQVPALPLAEQAGLGTADLKKIEVIGGKIADLRYKFPMSA